MVLSGSNQQRSKKTRCATAPAMVTRMRSHQNKPDREISVIEVCRLADQERAQSARGSRRDVLEHAYDNLISGIYRLPSSRPATAFTCPIRPQRDCGTARSVRSEPPSTTDCVRDVTPHTGKSLLKIQCDDVIPTRKSHGRGKTVTSADRCGKADKELSNIDISLQDLTSATRAKKYFPQLSLREVYDKIQKGEIAKCFIPTPRPQTSPDIRRSDLTTVNSEGPKDIPNKHFMEANMFFLNIRDLNFKIASGKASRDWGFAISKLKKRTLFTNSSFKTFISPKHTHQDEPAYKTYYDPPLVPRVNQKSMPVFFAGRSLEYKLPERLPEEIVFAKTADPKLISRRTSRGSVRSASASDEEFLDYEATFDKLL